MPEHTRKVALLSKKHTALAGSPDVHSLDTKPRPPFSYRSPLSPFSFSTSPVNCGCDLGSEVRADSDSAAQSSSMGWDRERVLRVTSPQSDPLSEEELSSREGFLKHKAKVTQGET